MCKTLVSRVEKGYKKVYFRSMATGINWLALETEYKTGNIKSVSEFVRQKGIKFNGNTSRKIKGWIEAREQYQVELQKKMLTKTQEKISDAYAFDIAEIRARHSKIAKFIQTKALHTLQNQDFETASQAVRALEIGVRAESGASGIDNAKPESFGSNNIPLTSTRYGQDLLKMNYSQLIDLLQKLRETNGEGEGLVFD